MLTPLSKVILNCDILCSMSILFLKRNIPVQMNATAIDACHPMVMMDEIFAPNAGAALAVSHTELSCADNVESA